MRGGGGAVDGVGVGDIVGVGGVGRWRGRRASANNRCKSAYTGLPPPSPSVSLLLC
jgi:hypothetical protein